MAGRQKPDVPEFQFPSKGEEFEENLPVRHRTAAAWQIVLQASTIIGIIALTALLLNIVNGAFGYVAGQNSIDPEELLTNAQEERMLGLVNTVSSEDDAKLADAISGNPYAIGFFGYAYYQAGADELRVLAVDGVEPTADDVESGDYGLSRPLFLYSSPEIMRQKPQVAEFINFYLSHVTDEIENVGYFPLS